MDPLRLEEFDSHTYAVGFCTGSLSLVDLVYRWNHRPDGWFWEDVARRLIRQEAPSLRPLVGFDCEKDVFCAYGSDREALVELGERMSALLRDPERIRRMFPPRWLSFLN